MKKGTLFNTEMVKAILEGRKTTTRRIIKPQPTHKQFGGFIYAAGDKKEVGKAMFVDSFPAIGKNAADHIKPPYQVGDILYVRETWCQGNSRYFYKADYSSKDINIVEFISSNKVKWHPSIHMPKEAARIFLKVVDVGVQRLQEITEDEAKAEGAIKHIWYQPYRTKSEGEQKYIGNGVHHVPNYITGFAGIWDNTLNINDKLAWQYTFENNPYVWVIEFERVQRATP